MNFLGLKQTIFDRIGLALAAGTDEDRRIGNYINESHEEVLRRKGFERARRGWLPFATISGNAFVSLPQSVDKIYDIYDVVNRRLLNEIPLIEARLVDPAQNFTTTVPYGYVKMDMSSPIAQDPSDASELFVKSSAAGDTTQTAYIEGITADGNLRIASAALNGQTAVSFGAAITWIRVTKFYLSAVGAGVVSLFEDSGAGTNLGSIGIGRTFSRYARIMLVNVPSAVFTLYADVDFTLLDMVNDTDEPFLPTKFHRILVSGALAKEYERREKLSLITLQTGRFERGIDECRSWMRDNSALPLPDRLLGQSQLGSFYPAGS